MTTEQAIEKLRGVIRLRHLAHATEECYAGWLARFCAFTKAHPSTEPAAVKMEWFLSDLARQDVAASTQK